MIMRNGARCIFTHWIGTKRDKVSANAWAVLCAIFLHECGILKLIDSLHIITLRDIMSQWRIVGSA
jgi:hypothetical protein